MKPLQLELQTLKKSDKIKFANEHDNFEVAGRNENFIICTRKYDWKVNNLKLKGEPDDLTEYTILDLKEGIRGPDNWYGKYNYETNEEITQALTELELPFEHDESMCISRKRSIPIKIESIKVFP